MRTLLCLVLLLLAAPALACTQPGNAEGLRSAVVEQTNAERRQRGLAALERSATLAEAARDHACWMARTGNFSHEGEGGSTLGERVRGQGYRFGFVAENIAFGQSSPTQVVSGWMQSRGHRRNMLSGEPREIGVAIAVNPQGRIYWVMVLGREL